MKKILLIATVQSHIAQFHKPLIEILKENECEIHVAAKNNLDQKNGLKIENVDKIFNIPFERNPWKISNIKSYIKLREIVKKENYDIIHSNTPVGGIIGRLLCFEKKIKCFYTAHGFHFYKDGPKLNWIIYYPIEKIFSKMTTKLITIVEEDFLFAKKKFQTKIYRINGVGVDTLKYIDKDVHEKKKIRIKNNIELDHFVIICTGELNDNKNQKVLIDALPEIIKKIPKLKLLLAGNGPNEKKLQDQIDKMGLNLFVKLIGYKTNLEDYISISDVVISASIREGLGLNIIEGMLMKKPIIASINRGHRELVKHGLNGLLVSPYNKDEFSNAIIFLYKNEELRKSMGKESYVYSQNYTKENVKAQLKRIYFE